MDQQSQLFDAAEDDRSAWATAEAAFTPLPLIRQHLQRAVVAGDVGRPQHVLDLGAGRGAFGLVCREIFPAAELVAVELRAEERPHLRRHYDEVITGDVSSRPVRRRLRQLGPFDLIIGNPPFGLVRRQLGTSDCWHGLAMSQLAAAGELHWLMPVDTLWRTKADYEWFTEHPLARAWLVPDRVAFLGGSGTDHRTYQWHVWDHAAPRDEWPTTMHPRLESRDRSWRRVPGDTR